MQSKGQETQAVNSGCHPFDHVTEGTRFYL